MENSPRHFSKSKRESRSQNQSATKGDSHSSWNDESGLQLETSHYAQGVHTGDKVSTSLPQASDCTCAAKGVNCGDYIELDTEEQSPGNTKTFSLICEESTDDVTTVSEKGIDQVTTSATLANVKSSSVSSK